MQLKSLLTIPLSWLLVFGLILSGVGLTRVLNHRVEGEIMLLEPGSAVCLICLGFCLGLITARQWGQWIPMTIKPDPSSETQYLKTLKHLLETICNSFDPEAALTSITPEIARLLNADQVTLVQHLPDSNTWEQIFNYGTLTSTQLNILELSDLEESLLWRLKQSQIIQIPDPEMQQYTIDSAPVSPDPGTWLIVPLKIEGRFWGSLNLWKAKAASLGWAPAEIDLAAMLASPLGTAIQHTQHRQQIHQITTKIHRITTSLEAEVQKQTDRLQQVLSFEASLKRITDHLCDSLDENYILQTVVTELGRTLTVESCYLGLYDPDFTHSVITYEFSCNSVESSLGVTYRFAKLADFYTTLFQWRTLQYCHLPSADHPRHTDQQTLCVVLIQDNEGALGELWLVRSKGTIFSPDEISLVDQVASQCAIAIRQARLYQASQAQIEALARINQLKDDFLSRVSHELRTPITSVLLALRMMSLTYDGDKWKHYHQLALQECERQIELINDLLDLRQLEASHDPLELEPIDLDTWTQNIVASILPQLHARRQTLDLMLPPNLSSLHTDRMYLSRILRELLINASKYTEPGGSIQFEIKSEANDLHFMIRNPGLLPATELPRLFDKFYRVPGGDRWAQAGTGLGLALVKQMVSSLHGSINVYNDQGWVTFTVRIPQLSPERPEHMISTT